MPENEKSNENYVHVYGQVDKLKTENYIHAQCLFGATGWLVGGRTDVFLLFVWH